MWLARETIQKPDQVLHSILKKYFFNILKEKIIFFLILYFFCYFFFLLWKSYPSMWSGGLRPYSRQGCCDFLENLRFPRFNEPWKEPKNTKKNLLFF